MKTADSKKPTLLERVYLHALSRLFMALSQRMAASCGFLERVYLRPGWSEKQLSPHENSPLKIGSTWFET